MALDSSPTLLKSHSESQVQQVCDANHRGMNCKAILWHIDVQYLSTT
jgi:hypothetical protein